MPKLLTTQLVLSRCPHCNVDRPNLNFFTQLDPYVYTALKRHWRIYVLAQCAGVIAASAVDSMLKAKNLTTDFLYSRIDEAVKIHLITMEMSEWAHDVRLDANDQRHADDDIPLPDQERTKKRVDFAEALGQLLFILPARVQRGIKNIQTA